MKIGHLYIFLYSALVLSPALLCQLLGFPSAGKWVDLSRNLALTGFTTLILQPVLAARFPFIIRHVNRGWLMKFHGNMGQFALLLLVPHPLLIAFGYAKWDLFFSGGVLVWLGKTALFLLVMNVFISLFRRRIGMRFDKWHLLHNLLAPSILGVAFAHSWFIGKTLQSSWWLKGLWLAMLFVSVIVFFYLRVLRQRVHETRHDTEDKATDNKKDNRTPVRLKTGGEMSRYTTSFVTVFLVLAVFLLTGLKKSESTPSSVPDFKNDIAPIFQNSCAISGCHDSAAAGGLNLLPEVAQKNLVGVKSALEPKYLRVDTGKPDKSFLLMKLKNKQSVGGRMPPGNSPLDKAKIELVERWIKETKPKK